MLLIIKNYIKKNIEFNIIFLNVKKPLHTKCSVRSMIKTALKINIISLKKQVNKK